MIHRFLALLAALVLLASCRVPPETARWYETSPQQFDIGPYIMLGGPGEAFIAVKTTDGSRPVVEWWPNGVAGAPVRRVEAERYQDLWVASLSGLPVGDRIGYRVRAGDAVTPDYAFVVGAAPGAPFRFAAFGDTRTGHEVHRAVIEAMVQHPFDFVIHTGDMVERGGIKAQWRLFFQIERPLLVDRPFVPAVGNHDKSVRNYYERYFLHAFWAKGKRYFVHDWGNLRMIAIDGMIEARRGGDQYEFVEAALAEGARRGMLMLLFLHFPPYSSGSHGSTLGLQETITRLARTYGVELVIAGHDHNYERTKSIDGTTYLVSGSAGAPIRPVNPQWFTAEARTEPHFLIIDVEGRRMTLSAYNLAGEVFDQAVIEDNPPAGAQ